jgi:hypothetical protein
MTIVMQCNCTDVLSCAVTCVTCAVTCAIMHVAHQLCNCFCSLVAFPSSPLHVDVFPFFFIEPDEGGVKPGSAKYDGVNPTRL